MKYAKTKVKTFMCDSIFTIFAIYNWKNTHYCNIEFHEYVY